MMRGLSNSKTEVYLRVASVAISSYDFVITLPAEWRFYRSQSSVLRLSIACILFILIRYVSVIVLILSTYGFFATSFTAESCRRFFLSTPIAKVFQTMVSQAILGLRTINISRRRTWVKWVVVVSFIAATTLEWFTDVYQRNPIVGAKGNCTPGNSATPGNIAARLSVWLYYVVSMLYDIITLAISTIFLIKADTRNRRVSRLLKIMLYDGFGYFVILTATNVFLIVYRTSGQNMDSAGASLGYAATWICTQRLLIHLRELTMENLNGQLETVVVSRQLESARDVSKAVRSISEKKPSISKLPPTLTTLTDDSHDIELDVQVRVEHSVAVEYQAEEHERGTFGRPNYYWDSRP